VIRRLNVVAAVAAVSLLVVASSAHATPRHKRLGHKPAPEGKALPAEVQKALKAAFPTGKVTGWWLEEKGEIEVFVVVPGSPVIEVVFLKKGKGWHLAGYEYPVPAASLTPKAHSALLAKYPKAKILEVELIFNASWTFLGYQVTINSGKVTEVFIKANGTFAKDPL
jgi:hypothetical protein